MKIGKYEYPNDVAETLKINRRIRDEINKFCKLNKLTKSKLIEEFYKTILVRWRDGSLNSSNGNCTINILRSTISKGK